MGGQRHAPAALPPGKEIRCPLYRRLGGPQGRFRRVRNISPLPGFDPRTVQSVASRYKDCIIPARGPDSSVGVATDYGLDVPRIESRWGRDFPPVQTGPGAHPGSCTMGTGSFPGVKCGRGVALTTYPLLVPRSWKSRAIPLPTLWATPGL